MGCSCLPRVLFPLIYFFSLFPFFNFYFLFFFLCGSRNLEIKFWGEDSDVGWPALVTVLHSEADIGSIIKIVYMSHLWSGAITDF